jgi:hypothetical protein
VASRLKSEKPPSISRKLSTWLVSAATQATTSASPACTARAARRSAITPLAPPVGMWSSQRGLKAQVLRHAHRGVGRQREAADRQAVDLVLVQPRLLEQRAQAWPRNQCAPRVLNSARRAPSPAR